MKSDPCPGRDYLIAGHSWCRKKARGFRFLLDMTGFTHEKLGMDVHQRSDPFVFAVGQIGMAYETHGPQVLRQLRGLIGNIMKMPVFFIFFETLSLIKNRGSALLLMFF